MKKKTANNHFKIWKISFLLNFFSFRCQVTEKCPWSPRGKTPKWIKPWHSLGCNKKKQSNELYKYIFTYRTYSNILALFQFNMLSTLFTIVVKNNLSIVQWSVFVTVICTQYMLFFSLSPRLPRVNQIFKEFFCQFSEIDGNFPTRFVLKNQLTFAMV